MLNQNMKSISIITLLLSTVVFSATAQLKLPKDLTIKYPFAQSPVPPAPDYGDTTNWSALPQKQDIADIVPNSSFKEDEANAKVDVFYIYPTIYEYGDPWNANVKDTALNALIDKLPVKNQATVFNGSCKVYVPRYRQAHLKAFFHLDGDGKKALDLAYSDISRAFKYYLDHYNQGRPIIIAGHSQGSYLGKMLMQEFFDGKPLQKQLVAAYLIGYPQLPSDYTTLNGCKDPTSTECIVGWGTFARGYYPDSNILANKQAICVNPITFKMDTSYVPFADAKGIVGRKYNHVMPMAVDAQVHNGVVWINTPKITGAKLLKIKNYHVADYNLFWVDLRNNVKQRVAAYLKE